MVLYDQISSCVVRASRRKREDSWNAVCTHELDCFRAVDESVVTNDVAPAASHQHADFAILKRIVDSDPSFLISKEPDATTTNRGGTSLLHEPARNQVVQVHGLQCRHDRVRVGRVRPRFGGADVPKYVVLNHIPTIDPGLSPRSIGVCQRR